MYVLGIDFGGGSCKATLLSKDGQVVFTSFTEYPTKYESNGSATQNPWDWYNAAVKTISTILSSGFNAKDIECLCFDAATHTAVLLAEDREVLCDSIYWTDTRAREEAQMLMADYGDEIFQKCKHYPDTIWTIAHIMLIKKLHPEIHSRIWKVVYAKDFVRSQFTGDLVTDFIEAQGSMLFNYDKMDWDEHLLSLCGLNLAQMPEIVSPLDVVGTIRDKAALDTGLVLGTKVICGSTDTVMEVLASGAIHEGDTTIKLATAGRICIVSPNLVPADSIINYSHLIKGLYYPGSATKSCASSLRWFRDRFGGDYNSFSAMAETIEVGSEGLIFHPYISGELTPYANPKLKGNFFGIMQNHGKAHFARSIMEGAALSLLDCFEFLKTKNLIPLGKVYVIGGAARSKVWRQIVSDVLNFTLINTADNDSSFGSAMCAGIAVGYFADFKDSVAKCSHISKITYPNHENHRKYIEIYKKYKKIALFLCDMTNE